VLELLVEVIAVKEAYYMLAVVSGKKFFSIRSVVANLSPANYYVILYCSVYVLSPYINQIFKFLNQREDKKLWNRFIVISGLILSVWPIMVDLLQEIFDIEWMGLSTVGAWGSQQGFTLTNFVLLYIVGGYLRFGFDDKKFSNKKIMTLLAVDVFMIFGWSLLCDFLSSHGLRSAWCYHNPLVILEAVFIFVLFKRIRISKNWINEMAKAAFTCYLVHSYILGKVNIEKYVTGNVWGMLVQIILLQVIIYMISYVLYKIYVFCTKRLMSKIGSVVDRLDIGVE
jgi:hypothetical protein